ncbi:MAG: hypothetical protein RMK18_04540 [Armatimonadota bacterium]|nr:hypothetical protein [Armatimonadota bacterium]MCX7778350.1 hypothetical protein [Armatimonadota bacterium]MDW8025118.1 hypothetical protein [Armatimonadota bacterium]
MSWAAKGASVVLMLSYCFVTNAFSEGVLYPPLSERKLDVSMCRFLSDQPMNEFDLMMRLQTRSSSDELVKVLINYQDERNYAFVKVGTSSVRVGKVEEGLEVELASAGLQVATKGKPIDVLVRQRRLWVEVFINGTRRIVLSQLAIAMQAGHVGYLVASKAAAVSDVSLQPIEEVYFSDDFMRSEGEQSDWQVISGEWKVMASNNPLRSANAFTYFARAKGKSGAAISVVGYPFWSDYSIVASVRCMDASSIGLILYWNDPQNYYLFKWTGSSAKSMGRKQLLKCHMGKLTVLFDAHGGFVPGQWYEVRAEASLNSIRVYIDERKVCEVRDGSLHRGMAGLYTASAFGAYFDDVQVGGASEFAVNFSDESFDGIVHKLTGVWKFVSIKGIGRVCEVETASEGKALLWESISSYSVDACVSTEGEWGDDASLGLCLNYKDEHIYHLARVVFGEFTSVELLRRNSGNEELLAKAPVKLDGKKPFILSASSDDGLLTISVNGEQLIQVFDASITSGMIGLYANSCKARFHGLRLRVGGQHFNRFNIAHEVFAHEYSMGNWAAAQSDWVEGKVQIGNGEMKALWHRADFWGDLEARARVDLSAGKTMFLISAAQRDANSGYRLELAKDCIRLFRNGVLVKETKLGGSPSPTHIRVRRVGKFILAYLDGTPAFAYEDSEPLRGSKFGLAFTGEAVRREDVELFTANSITDMFREAAINWRPSNGLWEVSQRWQCDPRWSFFSGISWNMVTAMSESSEEIERARAMHKSIGSNLAVVWSKYLCGGDITVEFAVAVKMARERGSYASYAQDLNITICADGSDLTSGYTFVFGGWRGTKSAIVRKSKVVAQVEHKPFGEDIHRKWFLVRVEKRGGKLRYFVDDKLLLEYDDQQPIDGKHIAIWTRDNGIMVARFTICAEQLLGKVEANSVIVPVKRTFYDCEAPPNASVSSRQAR